MNAIRQEITVQANGLIEVRSPELHQGDVAEITVLIRPANTEISPTDPICVDALTDWRQFAGIVKGHYGSSDNESIDADLAAEYSSDHEPAK